ncbi:MAG: Hsp20/alpha crystallin family protein [Gemmatimonadaceae bacterium]
MLYRTSGSQPIFAIRREIDRLFDDTFGGTAVGRNAWVPAVDVREERDAYRFDLELPGVDPSAVEVTTDQGVLTVRGEKQQRMEREGEEGRMHVTERTYGSFTRAFQLPQGVNEEDISAEFDHGLLTIRVPKRSRPEPRRIRIDNAVRESARTTSGERTNRLAEGERPGQSSQEGARDPGSEVQGGGSSASRPRTGRTVTSGQGR